MAENARPGDPHWVIRHLGAEHEIEGYAGQVSVRQGESFPLFVSSTSAGYRVTAFRLGWYQGDGARKVWQSGPLRGHQQNGPVLAGPTNTIRTDWDPALDVPTDDWPPGSYLLRLDADSGGQRYVPVTVRSASTAGKVVLKNGVETWQAYNTWGGYDLYKGPQGDYAGRSRAVSLDRPYDGNGADMFLTYERNVVKLAEYMGLPLAYVTSMDIAADPHLLDGASALISLGHDEYWSPSERANVTAARDAGVNLAFLGANALFRRTRLEATALGRDRLVVCYKTSYPDDPMYGKDASLVTSDWRSAPSPDPESSLIGTLYESYPATAAYRVVSPRSWVFKGTGVPAGAASATWSASNTTGLTPATRCSGRSRCCRIPRWSARASAATATPPTTRTPAGRASSTRARCAGWRRSSATSRTGSPVRRPPSSGRSPRTCSARSPTARPPPPTPPTTTWT